MYMDITGDTFAAIVINSFNRLAIASRMPPGTYPSANRE
jgi:hypothetical protein